MAILLRSISASEARCKPRRVQSMPKYAVWPVRTRLSAFRVSGVAALMMAAWLPAAAGASGCPAIPGESLVYVDIFDGPPERQADLVPDQHIDRAARRAWNIWQLEPGPEGLFVKCGYGKALAGPYRRIETIRLPGSTRSCRADFRTGPAGSGLTLTGFSCR